MNTNNSTNNNTNVNTNNNTSTSTNTNNNNNVNTNTSVNTNNNNSNSTVNSTSNNTSNVTSNNTNTNNNNNNTTSNNTNNNNNYSESNSNSNVNTNNTNNNNSTSNNTNRNINESKSEQVITQNINTKAPPASAIAPSIMSYSQDLCTTGVSGAFQGQVFGFSAGKTIKDENCERLKLSKYLYDMGMKVASVALLCQDERVFSAMRMAGTPCPYKGEIGEKASYQWAKNPADMPTYEKDKEHFIKKCKKERIQSGPKKGAKKSTRTCRLEFEDSFYKIRNDIEG